ncbi:MAG: glycoside hydrolase N-terminal domain-containing protein [Clostridia bacterium]|nr:glycoside hydrolase N-terminal domain-containing protein [Clostridia bacterium]
MKSVLTMKYPSAWHGDMWREGAPCGNGMVGALVYGGVDREYILLNHAHLWKGGRVVEIPDVHDALVNVRHLLDCERPDLANAVISNALRSAAYTAQTSDPLPLGDIRILRRSEQSVTGYRRRIDMEKAEVTVTWKEGGAQFTRSTFVSRADGLCYTRITCTKPGRICADVTLDIHDPETLPDGTLHNTRTEVRNGMVYYAGDNHTAYRPAQGSYGAVMRVQISGGTQETAGRSIRITGADEVLLVTYVFVGRNRADAFADGDNVLRELTDYSTALARHTELHQALYGGVDFSISETVDTSNEELLLDAFDEEASGELMETMYAYGRYLFVCSTAGPDTNGALPVHLIGLWNGTYRCFWAFHMFNVNFEMIYWQALSGNQPALLRTALDYVEAFMDDFRENAKKIFGCRGIYIDSVNTPESGRAACLADHIINWTAGAGWVAEHFYDYYRYTGDEDYLREHALPFMMEAALFYEDFLIERNGRLEFAPATSPENVPSSTMEKTGIRAQVTKNPAMDIAVARELLTNLLEGSEITGMYADKRAVWENMFARLPDYRYNEDGSLKEWADDFYTDNNRHRHHSHLYGIFPGHSVTEGTKEYDAFRLAEDKRMSEGLTSQSSWAMIYMACVNARLKRGEEAWFALSEMVRYCCMNNLFTVHNDWRRMGSIHCDDMRLAPFQIDANIGFPGAVNEMLLGCADGTLTLFPALPSRWKTGKLEGLRTVGGRIVSLYWEENRAKAVISAGFADSVIRPAGGWTFADGSGCRTLVAEETAVLELKRNN